MPDILLLRLDAPLVSFGGPMVDNRGVIQDCPPLSLLTGLLANALGYEHGDVERLAALQSRVRYAVRCDRAGTRLVDFHTVDLGQDFLVGTGWTTRGRPEGRAGASGEETHIRYREFLADSVHTVALALEPSDSPPDIDAVERALQEPARPLFIGRKCCLPAVPILLGRTAAPTLLAALRAAPRVDPSRSDRPRESPLRAWWPADEDGDEDSRLIPVTDERDWENQIVTGRRWVREGTVRLVGENDVA